MNPHMRALSAITLFSAVGLWSLLFHNVPWEFVVPHLIFFVVLTINTYFSVQFYSAFTPASAFQSGIDAALTIAYLGLALTIGFPLAFSLFALAAFTIAPAKYAHMLGRTPHDAILRKKILIDLLGTALCVIVLALTIMGYELKAAWILAGVFAIANIYLLAIKPMYAFSK